MKSNVSFYCCTEPLWRRPGILNYTTQHMITFPTAWSLNMSSSLPQIPTSSSLSSLRIFMAFCLSSRSLFAQAFKSFSDHCHPTISRKFYSISPSRSSQIFSLALILSVPFSTVHPSQHLSLFICKTVNINSNLRKDK